RACGRFWNLPRPPVAAADLIDTAVEAGIPADRCLRGTWLTRSDLAAADRLITAEQELRIVRNVLAATEHPTALAGSAGARYQLPRAGFLGFALLSSNTLGDAIRVGIRFWRLTSVFERMTLEVDRQTTAIVLDDRDVPADVRQFLVERDAATMVGVTPTLLGGPLPDGVRMALRRRPNGDAAVEELVDVSYGADRNAITFPTALLDRPLAAANPAVAAQCIAQCDELLARHQDEPTVASRVRRRLARDPGAVPLMRTLATEMGFTERTLRRRLAREGTGYRSLIDEVRGARAADLLSGGATVKQVAQQLGYSEPAAFHHAFVRWHALPPARFRRADVR